MSVLVFYTIGIVLLIAGFFFLTTMLDRFGHESAQFVLFLCAFCTFVYALYGYYSREVIKQKNITPQEIVIDRHKRYKILIMDSGESIKLTDAASVCNPVKAYLETTENRFGKDFVSIQTKVVINEQQEEEEQL